jgi:hypothetical protein
MNENLIETNRILTAAKEKNLSMTAISRETKISRDKLNNAIRSNPVGVFSDEQVRAIKRHCETPLTPVGDKIAKKMDRENAVKKFARAFMLGLPLRKISEETSVGIKKLNFSIKTISPSCNFTNNECRAIITYCGAYVEEAEAAMDRPKQNGAVA